MKTIFKKLTAAFSALAVAAAAVVFDVPEKIAEAASTHNNHKVCINSVCGDGAIAADNICTHGEKTWLQWNGTNKGTWAKPDYEYPVDGTYYLNNDIELILISL